MSKQQRTIASFDYQWEHLPAGNFLLSDMKWMEHVDEYILDELQMSREEIKGKVVLDAGCGQGRWSFGFEKLGCNVYGFDTSASAIQSCCKLQGCFFIADILGLDWYIGNGASFDLIWCWGVLHHTVDPEKGFDNLVRLLKPGGVIHLYLYGKKSLANRFWRTFFNSLALKRREGLSKAMATLTQGIQGSHLRRLTYPFLPFSPSPHSNFDAFSPAIASSHTRKELEKWFRSRGLTFTEHTPGWVGRRTRDLFVTGRRNVI